MIYYLNALFITILLYVNYKTDLRRDKLVSAPDKYLSNYLFIIASIVGVLLSGIRYQTGTDWMGYQDSFEYPLSAQYEMGYNLINSFLSLNGFSFEFLLFFVSCFYGLLCYLIFKLCVNKWLALLLLNVNISILYFGGNRQAIAQAIVALAAFILFDDFSRSKATNPSLIIAILLFLISASIHTSTIIFAIVLAISFFLRNKIEVVMKTTVIFSFATILLGAKSPFAPLIATLSKMSGMTNMLVYIDNVESGVAELDPVKDIVIIIYNLIIMFLMHYSLKLNFHLSPNLEYKKSDEYYGIIVNLIVIFYFIFCLYLGVSRDTSGRLLLYGRMLESVFFGGLRYGCSRQNREGFAIENINTLRIGYSQYSTIINSLVILSIVKLYFTFVSNGHYLPYKTILFPGMEFY
jgi:EpsG family